MKILAPIVRVAVLATAVAGFSKPAEARRSNHPQPTSSPPSLDVQPSPEVDARVAREVDIASGILEDIDTDNLLVSPYLVSAIYYHDGFLAGFPVDRPSADPERRIVGQICNMLSPDRKAQFVGLLHEIWAESDPPGPEQLMDPLVYSAFGGGARSHQDAIDLFAAEGSPVRSVSRGIVVLADRDWSVHDLFSTSSRKGGNAVIVFDPDQDRFYRYCHLSAVLVEAGELVAAGDAIGQVGHTGINASRPGHGHHLHFEANEFVDGRTRTIDYDRLRTMLLAWRTPPAARDADETP